MGSQSQAPGAPTNFRVVSRDGPSVTFAWDAPTNVGSGIEEYRVVYSDPLGAGGGSNVQGTTATLRFSEAVYTVFVVARYRSAGRLRAGPQSNSLTINPAPRQVTGVTIGTRTATSIVISWTALTNFLQAYEVSWDGGTTWTNVGNVITYTITGLTANTNYVIYVRGLNSFGDAGPQSSSRHGRTLVNAPGKPGTLTLDRRLPDGFTVNWTLGDIPNKRSVTSWEISNDDALTWINANINVVGGGDLTYTYTGLSLGTEYNVRVRGVNSQGAGIPSDALTVETLGPPKKVTGLQKGTVTDNTIAVSWAAPSDGGLAITHYSASSDNGITWSNVGLVTSYTFTRLQAGTDYEIKIRAENGLGTGPASDTLEVTTTVPTIVPITQTTPFPTNVRILKGLTERFDLGNYFSGVNNNYAINDITPSVAGSNFTIQSGDLLTISPAPDVDTNTLYTIQIVVTNNSGGSLTVNFTITVLAAATIPDKVTNVRSMGITLDSIGIIWDSPFSGGSDVTHYEISSDNGNNYVNTERSSTSYVLSGLTRDTTYQVRVRAVNSVGVGEASDAIEVKTLASDPADFPQNESVAEGQTYSYDFSLYFNREYPKGSVGSITQYGINTSGISPSSPALTASINNSGVFIITVAPQVDMDTEFSIPIFGVDANGNQTPDIIFKLTVENIATTTVAFSGEPTTLQIGSTYTTSLVFSNAIAGLTSRDFRLLGADDSVVRDASISVAPSTAGSKTNFTLTVTPPSNYNGTIKIELLANSVNLDGQSSQTLPATAVQSDRVSVDTRTVRPGAPSQVINVRVTNTTNTTITIAWDEPTGGTPTHYLLSAGSLDRFNVGNVQSYTITGLESGTRYVVRIQAVNNEGVSTVSDPLSIFTSTGTTVVFSGEPTSVQERPYNISVVFSNAIEGLSGSDFVLRNTSNNIVNIARISVAPTNGSKTNFVVTISPGLGNNETVKLELTQGSVELDGQPTKLLPPLPVQSAAVTIDTTGVVAAFLSEPTGTQDSNYTIDLSFTEDVTGLTMSDFRLLDGSNNVISGGSVSIENRIATRYFRITVNPPPNYNGNITLELLANSVSYRGATLPTRPLRSSAIAVDLSTTDPPVDPPDPTELKTVSTQTPFAITLSGPSDVVSRFVVMKLGTAQDITGLTADDIRVETLQIQSGIGTSIQLGRVHYITEVSPKEYDIGVSFIVPRSADSVNVRWELQIILLANSVQRRSNTLVTGPSANLVWSPDSFDRSRMHNIAQVSNLPVGEEVNEGVSYSYDLKPHFTGQSLSYSIGTIDPASPALPATINNGVLRVSRAPTVNMDTQYTIPIIVMDGRSSTDHLNVSFILTVKNASIAATTITFSGEPTTEQTGRSYTTSLVFSNAIAGLTSRDFRLLDADDNVVRNASISVVPATAGSKTNFTLTVTPPSNYSGVIKVELLANSVNLDGQSSQTLPATAVQSAAVTVDRRIATFNVFNFGITLTGETQFTSQWDPFVVEGFTLEDITVSDSNVILSNLTIFDPIGDMSLVFYTFDVTPPANAVGSFILSVAENILTDPPRNSAYTSASFSYDTRPDETPPTLTWNEPTAIQGGAFNLPLNFSEPVLGLTQDDFSASSGATISYTGVSGAIETPIITITPTDGQTGSIVVTLRENAVTDMAGNGNVESSSLPIRFDTQNPHVITWQYPALLPVIETPINVTTIFNEPVRLNTSLITIVATLSDGTTETLLFTKTPAGSVSTAIHSFMITTIPEDSAGTILITLQANAALDSINNRNEEITSQTIAFDTQPDARFERGLHIVKVEVPDGINTETTATARVFFNKAPVGSPDASDFRLDGLASAQIMSVLPVMDNPIAFDVLISRDLNDSGLLKIELEI